MMVSVAHDPSCASCSASAGKHVYRGTSLIKNSALLGPYSRTMHRALWWVLERVAFL